MIARLYVILTVLILGSSAGLWADHGKRAIVASDCVTVRYLLHDDSLRREMQINSQGTLVAYLVQIPNLDENRNDVQLYVKALDSDRSRPEQLVLSANGLSQLQWLEDGRHVAVLMNDGQHVSVVKVDTGTGSREVLVKRDTDIREFSIDSRGSTVLFAIESPDEPAVRNGAANASGYRVPFERQQTAGSWSRTLFVTREEAPGEWTPPEALAIRSPFSDQTMPSLPYALSLRLSLSPDGHWGSITYKEDGEQVPVNWKASPLVSKALDRVGFALVTVIVDLSRKTTTLVFPSPWSNTVPLWRANSQSFAIVSQSPVGSRWELKDIQNRLDPEDAVHLFEVEPGTGKVEQVFSPAATVSERPLAWQGDGSLIVRTARDTIGYYSDDSGQWLLKSAIHIPLPPGPAIDELVSDGIHFVDSYQAPATPPELFLYQAGRERGELLVRLNPQFDRLTLAPAQAFHWKSSTGYDASGLLLFPPDYTEGLRYPLVIQTYVATSRFFCDSGLNHWPSFAPQPLANGGMMYLIRTYPADWNKTEEVAHYPSGYPGGIREAAFQMDLWDSAVETLDARGLIDPHRIGIIGFSRSGWFTEFILAHSGVRYRAATVTDNIQYSLGEYWLLHSDGILRSWDAMYGGPPYGETLRNWSDYSVSFNLDKFHTPVLMEEMGYGVHDDRKKVIPGSLALHYEVFTGLNRRKKPVEMYYYPDEEHAPDHPQARLASLQRNVDWYRFWLQGYERPNPEDPDQYSRWHELMKLQQEDAAQIKGPVKPGVSEDKRSGR
jgi:dipeptidyl aminopeptidase/acylaminoacyl peptidase